MARLGQLRVLPTVCFGHCVCPSSKHRSAIPTLQAFAAHLWSCNLRPRNRLVPAHNTFVNEGWLPTWSLRVHADKLGAAPDVRALNNLLVGVGAFSHGTPGRFDGNLAAPATMLAAPELLDYGLPVDSWLRGRVDDPAIAGEDFGPRREFRLQVGTAPLIPSSRWAPGAFQR